MSKTSPTSLVLVCRKYCEKSPIRKKVEATVHIKTTINLKKKMQSEFCYSGEKRVANFEAWCKCTRSIYSTGKYIY